MLGAFMKYILFALTLLLSCCAAGHSHKAHSHSHEVEASADHHGAAHHAENEPRPYDNEADAEIDINQTLLAAQKEGKLGLLVFGANWCHDSRALAGYFEKPRFQTLLRDYYKLAYIDVGQKNRNIDLARKFGVDDIVGTPTIFVTNSDGDVLNLGTAPTWRNAASRNEDDVFDYFKGFAHPKL
jgi:thioredoxin-related protein